MSNTGTRRGGAKRRAFLGGLCAMSVGLILWGATLGAMALTRPADAHRSPPATVYQPTGLISAVPDADGNHPPRLAPAAPFMAYGE